MTDREQLPALDAIPVFPLPEITLFPHTHLPLHIFEPRYRALLEDVLAGPEPHCFAMGTQLDKPDGRTLGEPPVFDVTGVGRLVEYSRLPDGRYMLVLEGIGRARLQQELPQRNGYRRFAAQWLPDVMPAHAGGWDADLALELKALAITLLREQAEKLRRMVTAEQDLGRLADILCGYLPLPPEFKLAQMDCPNVMERAARTITQLEAMLLPAGKPLPLDTQPPAN